MQFFSVSKCIFRFFRLLLRLSVKRISCGIPPPISKNLRDAFPIMEATGGKIVKKEIMKNAKNAVGFLRIVEQIAFLVELLSCSSVSSGGIRPTEHSTAKAMTSA